MNINNPPSGLGNQIAWCIQGIQAIWRRLTGIEQNGSGGSTSMKIGDPVVGGNNRSVLFIDALGKLAQNTNFYYYGTGISIGNADDNIYLSFDSSVHAYSIGDVANFNNFSFYLIDDTHQTFTERTGKTTALGIKRDYSTMSGLFTRQESSKDGTYALLSDVGPVESIDLPAQSAATPVINYPVSGNHTYRVGGYVTITAIAVDVLGFQVTWLDPNSNAHTRSFYPLGVSATVPNLTQARDYEFSTMDIRCKDGSTIGIATVLITPGGTITYDVGASIMLIN